MSYIYIYTEFTIYTPVASFSKSLMHPLILIRDKPGAGDKGGVGGLRGVLALDPRQPGNQTNTANPPCPNTSVLSKENHQASSVLLYPVILKVKSQENLVIQLCVSTSQQISRLSCSRASSGVSSRALRSQRLKKSVVHLEIFQTQANSCDQKKI